MSDNLQEVQEVATAIMDSDLQTLFNMEGGNSAVNSSDDEGLGIGAANMSQIEHDSSESAFPIWRRARRALMRAQKILFDDLLMPESEERWKKIAKKNRAAFLQAQKENRKLRRVVLKMTKENLLQKKEMDDLNKELESLKEPKRTTPPQSGQSARRKRYQFVYKDDIPNDPRCHTGGCLINFV